MARINFWQIRSIEKIKKTAELVQKEYSKNGYVAPQDNKLLAVSPHSTLPTSYVFMAESESKIIGTVTVVGDGKLGLPMESIYKEEVAKLRKEGKKLAEISQLAVDRDFLESLGSGKKKIQLNILTSLFRLAFYCARSKKITTLCITINPKHDNFYKILGFSEIGALKYYPFVNNAPALARVIEIGDSAIDASADNMFLREIINQPINDMHFQKEEEAIIFSI